MPLRCKNLKIPLPCFASDQAFLLSDLLGLLQGFAACCVEAGLTAEHSGAPHGHYVMGFRKDSAIVCVQMEQVLYQSAAGSEVCSSYLVSCLTVRELEGIL